ncbi:MAG: DUF2298 domain-containing protein [Chloroflexi bacterium]|nr:DUF2298 domain-containing protein [Chloroflexota bacterium]
MLEVVLWLSAAYAIALAAFPLCFYLLPNLRDRGASIAMPFGLLTLGYASWILSVLRIVPSTQVTAILLLIIMTGVSAWVVQRNRQEIVDFVVREWKTLATGQVVFLGVFAIWITYRFHDPSISHTEQPMDFMFLNSTARSMLGTPEDAWLRGEGISYYYFGYWNFALLTKLTGIVSSVTYNLSLALVPAMAAVGMFGLVSNLVRADKGRFKAAVLAGVTAALLLVFLANLEGVLEFFRANGIGSVGFWSWIAVEGLTAPAGSLTEQWWPTENWWWWRATRVIGSFDAGVQTDYTIHEFPAFSYILGDLHPHVMSVPFVVMFLGFLWNFWRAPSVWSWSGWRLYLSLFLIAFLLGGLGFTNMWDLPVFGLIFLLIAALRVYRSGRTRIRDLVLETAPFALLVGVVAFVLYSPYFLSFTSQVGGIGALDGPGTRSLHFVLVWAPYLVAVAPFVVAVYSRTTIREDWTRTTLYALAAGFLPFAVWVPLYMNGGGDPAGVIGRLIQVLPLVLLVTLAAYATLWLIGEEKERDGLVFAMALASLGLALIMGPELLFVDDSFGGAHERMNTVFKLYYQGWTVLAAATGYVIYYFAKLITESDFSSRLLLRFWGGAFVLVLIASIYYVPAATASKAELYGEERTLDGLQHVERFAGPEYRAIEYVRENVGQDSAILEAVGGGYSEHGRIASSTGVPTALNWPGHQMQWRGSSTPFAGREQDVQTIYQTLDISEAASLLDKYDVDHVYVGPRERNKYGDAGLEKFGRFMTPVFSEADVVIYRR